MRIKSSQRIPGLKVSEADVQRAVVDMLELDGWRAIRTDPVSDRSRGKGFGEIGMPDYLFLRYGLNYSGVGVLWVEFKAPGKTLNRHQVVWHSREGKRGALIFVVSDAAQFRETYKTSGLMRNKILS
jgi:hypothetical protein